MATSKSTAEPRLIVQNIISTGLQFLQYGRLMLVLFALGIVIALAYYVYGRPVYFSRSMVRVTMLDLPVNSDSGRDESRSSSYRTISQRLASGTLVLRTVQKMKFIGPSAAPEDVAIEVMPTLRIDFVDGDTVQINVWSYYPEVVRGFAKALIQEWEEMERETRNEFRDKALNTYIKEADEYRKKSGERLRARMKYETEHELAELFIKQHQLANVPKEIVLTKSQLNQMDEIRRYFTGQKDEMDTVAKLSLLSYKLDQPTEVGSISRGTDGSLSPAVTEGAKKLVDVVVQPSMVTPMTPWQKLDERQRELKAEIMRQGAIYKPGHEVMVKLERELVEVQDKLKDELAIAQQKFDLDYTRLQDKLKTVQEKMPEYNDVTTQFEQSRQDYKLQESGDLEWDKGHAALTAAINKLTFGENKERISLRFLGIEMLRDKDPISPNKSKLLMIGLALGLGLACGAPLAIGFLNTTASRVQEIESVTGLTGIGVVPNTSPVDLDAIFRSPAIDSTVPNHLLEAFRIIRSQILIRPNNQKKNQVIMVTSARPSEGKSTQAANLAWAFYSMGERTLLVDCDLRRGRVAKITGVKNAPGLTNLLVDKCTDAEAVSRTQSDMLDVLPRGPVIAGTTEILCQEKFHGMIEEWRKQYDRIIIDSPPVLGLSETASLQQIADGVVLVVRSEVTRMVDVTATVDQLRRSGAHFFGFVLNAVDLSKLTNYYYYYYYSPDYYGDFIPSEQEPTAA
ncbi:MAG: Capsular exopolysaccharide family [Verrucomicrobiaceae bacterium]|nr:Capsular exopolysaccharide family [Verrucomicrobiaceae bacterium]